MNIDERLPGRENLASGPESRGARSKSGVVSAQALERIDPGSAVAILAAVPAEEVWLQSLDSERTRRAYRSDVRQFIEGIRIASSDELYAVTPPVIIAWRRRMAQEKADGGMGLKRATVRRKLSALSSLYEHLVEQGIVDFNPVQQVKRPGRTKKDRKGSTAPLVQEEARAMLNAPAEDTVIGARDRAILSLGFQNGLRRSEIAHLTVGCIEIRERLPHITYTAKGGDEHTVPLNPQAHKRLLDYLELAGHRDQLDGPMFRPTRPNHVEGTEDMDRHMDPDMIDRIVKKWAEKVLGRVRGISAHSMRATFVTRTLENGCPLERVQHDVGHAHVSTTQLYDHRGLSPEEAAPFFANY